MIITEQLALQIGYKYRFVYNNKTVYFKTLESMTIEYALLPDNFGVHMEEYFDLGTGWLDIN